MSRELDRPFLLCILFLLGLGVVQVYSSSFIFAIESFSDGLFFVKKQALFAALGVATLLIVAYMPWHWVVRLGLAIWALAVVGVVLTLIPGVGVKVGGAARWLNLFSGLRIEPTEFLKYTYPFAVAAVWSADAFSFSKKQRGWLTFFLVLPLALVLQQPDFGTVAILTTVLFAILFSRGLPWKYVFAGGVLSSIAAYFLIVKVEYRMARLQAFIDPWSDPAQKGFQVIQSLLGFFSGGLTGVGIGQGQGKLFFLPEAHTDFTLSVLGEELGFIGVAVTFFLFGYIALRGLQIVAKAREESQQILSLGVTLTFAVTALVNSGVALGVLPTKGLGMPFLSYGGSALLATCFGLGVLLNIEKMQRLEKVSGFIKIKGE
jgi:cell division protein FtsW